MQSELNFDLLLTTCIYLILMSYLEYSVKILFFVVAVDSFRCNLHVQQRDV